MRAFEQVARSRGCDDYDIARGGDFIARKQLNHARLAFLHSLSFCLWIALGTNFAGKEAEAGSIGTEESSDRQGWRAVATKLVAMNGCSFEAKLEYLRRFLAGYLSMSDQEDHLRLAKSQ